MVEWQELGFVDDNFDIEKLEDKHKHLPLDTKYFTDIKAELLGGITDLDNILNGVLIKSENYQAMQTILPKFKERIQCIYIDPPFNTGSDFDYKDGYQDSTWLSIMSDRLVIAREFLRDDGSLYLHLDYRADYRGRELLDNIFGKENFRNEIVWHYSTLGRPKDRFAYKHDNVISYGNNGETFFSVNNAKEDYSDSYITSHFTDIDDDGKKCRKRFDAGKWRTYYPEEGMIPNDVWELAYLNSQSL